MATPVRIPDELIAHRFLVVADIGITGDYKTEPRHIIELMLPRDDITTLTQEQAAYVEHELRAKVKGLPYDETPLHVWHLDQSGTPALYLNDLARNGAAASEALVRMVTCPQPMHTVRMLLHLEAATTIPYECPGDFIPEDHWDTINAVIDTRFPGLCCTDYSDYRCDGETLTVDVHGWISVVCQLPFQPSTRLSLPQISYAIASGCKEAANGRPWQADEDGVKNVWVVSRNEPDLSLRDLAWVKQSRLSMRTYHGACRANRRAVPRRLLPPLPRLILR